MYGEPSLGGSAAASADRPSADALRVQHVLGDPDLLVAARAGRGARPTVGVPGARGELQATGEAVTGADPPVATRLALRDGVPVHAVRPVGGRRRDIRARRQGVRSRRRRSIRSRRRRSVRSRRRRSIGGRRRRSIGGRRRRSVRSRRRRRSVRSRGDGRRVRVEARRHVLRVSGGRWDGHERARDRGKNERLSDVLQVVSFRGARAKASPQMWAEAVWLMPALKRAVWVRHGSGGPSLPGGVTHLPRSGFRRPWRRSHAGPWIQFLITFRNPLWANRDRRRPRRVRHLRKSGMSVR